MFAVGPRRLLVVGRDPLDGEEGVARVAAQARLGERRFDVETDDDGRAGAALRLNGRKGIGDIDPVRRDAAQIDRARPSVDVDMQPDLLHLAGDIRSADSRRPPRDRASSMAYCPVPTARHIFFTAKIGRVIAPFMCSALHFEVIRLRPGGGSRRIDRIALSSARRRSPL